MATDIWQRMRGTVAGWIHRLQPTAAPQSQPSAFQRALADDLRRLRACQAELIRDRERLRQRHGHADLAVTGGIVRDVAEFEVMARQSQVSPDEVKQAFRRLAKQCHPDHGGNPRLFTRLVQSYQQRVGAQPQSA